MIEMTIKIDEGPEGNLTIEAAADTFRNAPPSHWEQIIMMGFFSATKLCVDDVPAFIDWMGTLNEAPPHKKTFALGLLKGEGN